MTQEIATSLPFRSPQELARQFRALARRPLDDLTVGALAQHYQELRRWNPRLALIGPGTVPEVLPRHYGESLAALALLDDLEMPQEKTSKAADASSRRELVDVGSGAGFPGLVLAAARRDLRVTLVESRQRKWSFLTTASRKAGLPCLCLNARVEAPLPAGLPATLDVVTLRALRLTEEALAALARRLVSGGRFLFWAGSEDPEMPRGLAPGRVVHLEGSERRRIVEFRRP